MYNYIYSFFFDQNLHIYIIFNKIVKLIIGLLSQNENQRKKPCKHIYRLFQKENKTLYIDKEKKRISDSKHT